MNMACTLFRMTPEESLAGVTCHGAKALGIEDRVGSLEIGKSANIVHWDAQEPAELSYRIDGIMCKKVLFEGKAR